VEHREKYFYWPVFDGLRGQPEHIQKHIFAYMLRSISYEGYIVEGYPYGPIPLGEITPVTMPAEPELVSAPGTKNPDWMEIYWDVFTGRLEQDEYYVRGADNGGTGIMQLLDLNRDGTPELLFPVYDESDFQYYHQMYTIREGQARAFEGGFPYGDYAEWGYPPRTSLYRNKDTGEEKFFCDVSSGGCMGTTATFTEYLVDWDNITITKGEVVRLSSYTEGWEGDSSWRWEYYGREIPSEKEYLRLKEEFDATWQPVPDMTIAMQNVAWRYPAELQWYFFKSLRSQGYDVPEMPPAPIPDESDHWAVQRWLAFEQIAEEQVQRSKRRHRDADRPRHRKNRRIHGEAVRKERLAFFVKIAYTNSRKKVLSHGGQPRNQANR